MKAKKGEKPNISARRNIFALGFVSFFTDISSEMVFSLLPTFILGLPGSSVAVLGLIEGVAESLSYGIRAVSGVFSDKFKRRKAVVLVGYGISNVVKPLFSAAQTAVDAFIIRVTDRIGKGVRTAPRDALLSESVSEKNRGAAFGLHRALDQAGAILGPVIASVGMLLVGLTARDIFWLSFIPGLIALLILLFLVQERTSKSTGEFKLLAGMRTVLKGKFLLLLMIVSLFSLGAFNFSFVLLNAREAGVIDPLIPLIYAVVNVGHTVVAIPAGVLSDRIGKEKALVLGYTVFLFVAVLILFSPTDVFNASLIAVIFGIYLGIVETVQRVLVPEYVESSLRGTAYGFYYLVVGASFFVANTVVGTLWNFFGSSAASIYSLTLSSIAIIGMLLFLNYQKRKRVL